jgi:hypothetical protein
MRYIYATQFNVRNGTFEEVQEIVRRWFHGSYQNSNPGTHELVFDDAVYRPHPGNTVRALHRNLEDDGQFLKLEWTHPDGSDEHLQWTTEVMLAEEDGEIEFGTTLGISSDLFRVRPIGHLDVRAPGVVRRVLNAYECGLARFEIPTDRILVEKDDVGILVKDVLEEKDRALPVVLISQEPDTGSPICDVEDIQWRLTGLAHVYEIDRSASFELTGLVGKVRSCFNGAVRLYWPEFSRDGAYRRHTLYLPERIRSNAKRGREIGDKLFRILSNVASARFREGEIWQRLKREADRRQHQRVDQLKKQVERQEKGVDEALEELANDLEKIRIDRDNLREEVIQLRAEKANYEENLEALREHSDADEQVLEEIDSNASAAPSFSTVEEAVLQADADFDDLQVWTTAIESSKESTFARPEDVYSVFKAIAELASIDEDEEGETGPWDQFFEKRGFEYKRGESEKTMNLYGDERVFYDRDTEQRLQMEKHITLGGGSRENCEQIFFDRAPDGNGFAIGYSGRHLPYASMST